MLAVRGLAKHYRRPGRAPLHAIDAVDFDVAAGEIVCIVGTSGCGKSTLLGMIAGLDQASLGTIRLDGADIDGPGADRGMVFQRDCLFPWLTVRENVGFAFRLAANARLPGAGVRRVDALIAQVGLSAFGNALPRELSGGMRQRVAIARALVTRPRVLLLDEPFGALDAQTREQMQALLLEVVKEHRITVLFVTHDVEEAVYLGNRVLVMHADPGRIVADLPIRLPAERSLALKLDEDFAACRRQVLSLLHEGGRSGAGLSTFDHHH
jgi:NitT/TauT family transport system ATP-binding protein